MLLQFSVTNHRSIKNKAVISMKAAAEETMKECLLSPDGKKKLVPAVAVCGANAAGKSNLLHALLLMREMVCGGYALPLKGGALPQEPFSFTENGEPTAFEAVYYYDGVKYAYGYSFDKREILSEYLYHWPKGREALVFEREKGRYVFRGDIQEQSALSKRTPPNRLYLTSSNEWNCAQTEKAYLWFRSKLRGLPASGFSNATALEAIRRGGREKQKILTEMLTADLGICDVNLSGTEDKPLVFAIHRVEDEAGNVKNYPLPLERESMGTRRFFSRIGAWLDAMENGAVLAVDEIEASMHTLLARRLIEMMQDPSVNTRCAQLIFTTHDTGLLDLSLLRRDQIWFAERHEKTMQTEFYALTEFAPRKGENVARGYLQGRYGAVPFVGAGTKIWAE